MGLRNGTASANADATQPQFETEELPAGSPTGDVIDGDAIIAPTSEAEAAARTLAASSASQTSTPPVTDPQDGVVLGTALAPVVKRDLSAVLGSKFQPALLDMQGVIDPAGLEFDTFPRITVGLDGFSDDKDADLGKIIRIKLMSWNKRYIVTAGEDDSEANELTRFSLDGIHLDNGEGLCKDYVEVLKKTHGYDKAAIKEYYQLYAFLVGKSTGGPMVEVPEEDQMIITIQCPPRSVAQFQRFQIEQGVKISKGILKASDEIVLTQEKVKGKTKNYAKILFNHK